MAEAVLERVLEDLNGIRDVEAAYLYGSRAAGKGKPYSDYDICVITRKGLGAGGKERIMSAAWDNVDVNIYWDLSPAVRYRMFKEGKPLLNRNSRLVNRLKADAVLEYMDLKPLLQKHSRRTLALGWTTTSKG
jgi:uncharacterized protein